MSYQCYVTVAYFGLAGPIPAVILALPPSLVSICSAGGGGTKIQGNGPQKFVAPALER